MPRRCRRTRPGPPVADFTSITRLDEALTAQVSGQAVQLTIDAANLRYSDSASMRTLVMAVIKAKTRTAADGRPGGRTTRSFG